MGYLKSKDPCTRMEIARPHAGDRRLPRRRTGPSPRFVYPRGLGAGG